MEVGGNSKDERTKLLQKERGSSGGGPEPVSPSKCCCSILKAGMEQCWSVITSSVSEASSDASPDASSSSRSRAPLALPEDEECPTPEKIAKYESTASRSSKHAVHDKQNPSNEEKSHNTPFIPSCLGDRTDVKGCGIFAGCDSRFIHSHEQSSYTMAGGDPSATEDISPASDSSSPVKDTFPHASPMCDDRACKDPSRKGGRALNVEPLDNHLGRKASGNSGKKNVDEYVIGCGDSESTYRLPPCEYTVSV